MSTSDQKNNDGKVKWNRERTTTEQDLSDAAPSWLSYHYGKLMIAGVLLAIIAFIIYMLIDNS